MGIKISNLPTATESQTTDIVPIVQDGTTKKIQQSVLFKNLNDGMTELNNEMTDLDSRLEEAIAEFSTPLKYKGQVQTFNDLPVNADNGDIYSVVSENKNYVWNGTEWIEYSQTINIDDEIKTTLTTQEASEVEITNVAPVNGKIDVSGNSTQETRSGKNLAKIPDGSYSLGGNPFTVENGIIKVNGAYSGNTVFGSFQTNSGNAVFSVEVTGYTDSSVADNFYVILQKSSDNSNWSSDTEISVGSGATKIKTTTLDSSKYYRIRLYGGNNNSFTNGTIKVQLEYGTEKTSFEPYGVSPSPDYPSEIHNVGDNVNLLGIEDFTETTKKGLTYSINNDEININGTATGYIFERINLKTSIKLKANEYYAFSLVSTGSVANSNYNIIFKDANNTTIFSRYNHYLPYIFTDKEGEITQVSFEFGSGIAFSNYKFKLQIKEGSMVYPFSPYNCGNANIEVSNKNLFDVEEWVKSGNNSNYYSYSDGVLSINALDSRNYNQFLESERIYLPNGNYYLSNIGSAGIRIYPKGDSTEVRTNTFTVTAGYIYLKLVSSGVITCQPQIEKGTTATSYVPHQEQLRTFPFTEGQRLYLGDYLASDGIHHKMGQVVLNGTEKWALEGTYAYTNISTAKGTKYSSIMSNYFKYNENASNWGEARFGTTNKNLIIYGIIGQFSTLNEFKTWLSTHNTVVQYELATETIEPYTEEQEEAYWQLQHCLMYEGYTKIECIDEIKCKFKVEYSYNNELNTTYQGKIDEINEDIHNLDNKVDENINRIENEINTLHSYSTSEQVVGTWIDGKPLYKKVIQQSFTPTFDTNYSWSTYELSTPINNVDKIINCVFVGTKECTPAQVHVSSSSWQFWINQNFSYTHIIVVYTKTTD